MPARRPITENQRLARSANLRAGRETRQAVLRAAVADRVAAGKKTCSWCRRVLELGEFYRDASHGDGHRYECISCLLWARDSRRHPGTALTGFELACCGGELYRSGQTGFWACRHRRRCTARWQPAASGRIDPRLPDPERGDRDDLGRYLPGRTPPARRPHASRAASPRMPPGWHVPASVLGSSFDPPRFTDIDPADFMCDGCIPRWTGQRWAHDPSCPLRRLPLRTPA